MRHILLNRPDRRYYDYLPPYVAAGLLGRDVSDEDLNKIWNKRKKPFVSFAFLDDIFLWIDESELLRNRRWVASLYKFFEDVGVDTPSEKQINKITDFVEWIKRFEAASDFQREVVIALARKGELLRLFPKELLIRFLSAFESGNLCWIQMLSCLSILLPNDPQVILYREQYRLILDNKTT
jgi:hypothetical protein